MTVFVVSWTIDISSSDNGALVVPDVDDVLKSYPVANDHHPNAPVVEITTDGGSLGQISVSQEINAGNARTARSLIVSGNPLISDAGFASVMNGKDVVGTVSDLTIVNSETGESVQGDKGLWAPDPEDQVTTRPSRRRARATTVEPEPEPEPESTEEESTEEESTEEESTEEEEDA